MNASIQTLFSGLITSKMRVRILMRLFLNPTQNAYLRELANEFDASSSQVSEELNNLIKAGLLQSSKAGRQINYSANESHPLFPELHSMVSKALGMDRILDSIIERLGHLKKAVLLDDYAKGKDTGLIDLMLIGDIDQVQLQDLVRKTEKYIGRKIRTLVLTEDEYSDMQVKLSNKPSLVIWESNS